MADPIVNFFKSTLVGTYSDADTSITIATGDGALLPDPSTDGAYNLTIFEGLQVTGSTEFEIVRVTARSGDVLTVTRGEESTTPLTIGSATHSILMSATKKTFDDINDAIANVDLTTLTNVESITYDNDGNEVFQLPAGTTAQRPNSPQTAYLRWNTDDERIEVYNGNRWAGINLVGFESVTLGVATATVTANDAVAQITTFIGQFGTPASAFSVRQLGNTDVSMRVRRSSDNAEQNIGFVDGDLDETALTTFVGANDGFVTTWYDQSVDNSTLPAEYGSGATASYSLRLVDSTYTGDAIRVRRSSDNTEQDIGFVDGELDTSSLETFCSGTNGFVTTWYDQSGSNNATQSTAGSQPQIVSSGTTIKENGKPALDFDGTDDLLQADGVSLSQAFTMIMVVNQETFTTTNTFYDATGTRSNFFASGNDNDLIINSGTILDSGDDIIVDQTQLYFNLHNSTSSKMFRDGVEIASGNAGSDGLTELTIGNNSGGNGANYLDGKLHELIAYDSDQSSNRESIELNQASYYDIGVSIGATQSTAGSQPKIVSSGTVIKENSVPAIEMDGTNHMDTSFKVNGDGDVTFFIVATPTGDDDPAGVHSLLGEIENTNDSYGYILFYDTRDADQNFSYGHYQNVVSDYDQVDSSQKIRGTQYLITTIRDVDSDHELFIDGVSQGTTTTNATSDSTNNLRIGDDHRVETDRRFEGTFNEIIFFRADKSADRTDIESDIATYFNITI